MGGFPKHPLESIERLEATILDYATFIAFEPDYMPNEDEWDLLMSFTIDLHEDYHALLESTAVRVLPAELVKAFELNERKRADEVVTDLCATVWQQYAVPLRLRQTPITEAERRGLEYVYEVFRSRLGYVKERRKLEEQVLELLDKHNLGH